MEHTKASFGQDDPSGAGAINSDLFSGGCFTAEAVWPDKEVSVRRIVACVNACAGVGTEYLEDNGPIIELVREHNSVLKQRDELLAALEPFGAIDLCAPRLPSEFAMLVLRARTAISNAKGSAT